MTATSFVPLILAAVVWLVFWRLNRKTGWFTIGEVMMKRIPSAVSKLLTAVVSCFRTSVSGSMVSTMTLVPSR